MKKPEIRTSSLDDSIGMALGTAGLYEIEELVAEIHQEDPLLEQITFSELTEKSVQTKKAKKIKNRKYRKKILSQFLLNLKFHHQVGSSPLLFGKFPPTISNPYMERNKKLNFKILTVRPL